MKTSNYYELLQKGDWVIQTCLQDSGEIAFETLYIIDGYIKQKLGVYPSLEGAVSAKNDYLFSCRKSI